jgi:hypothetical protein
MLSHQSAAFSKWIFNEASVCVTCHRRFPPLFSLDAIQKFIRRPQSSCASKIPGALGVLVATYNCFYNTRVTGADWGRH